MASVAEIGIAVCMVDVRANEVSEGAADEDVRREVIAPGKSSNGNRKRGSVGHELDPCFRIFMGDDARHGPREHRMAGGK